MLFEVDGLLFILLLGFWLWALLDVIATDSSLCRNLPKGVWLILLLLLFDIGALAWVLLGRPPKGSWQPGSTDFSANRRPVGLEDEPRYSPSPTITDRQSEELDQQLDEWEREQGRKRLEDLDQRELELKRRELELRERELELREQRRDEPNPN